MRSNTAARFTSCAHTNSQLVYPLIESLIASSGAAC